MASPVTGFTHLSQSMPVRGHAAATIGAPDSTRSRWQDTPFVNDIRLTRGDLLEMNGARGADAQTRNALSTAHDALGVIGGLLENVGTVLGAAASRDASFDLKSDQARIDGAIGIIDSVAMSTTFAGKKLLDGSYAARMAARAVKLPNFVSTVLGKAENGEALRSLVIGGSNDLESGRIRAAGKVVVEAVSQVRRTRGAIDAALGKKAVETPATEPPDEAAGWVKSAAREILADPGLAVVAVANSEPRDVLGLITGK